MEQADDDMKKVYCPRQGLTVTGHKKATQEYKAQVSNNKARIAAMVKFVA